MKVVQLTLTYNRHTLLERLVSCFLNQDYDNEHTLFIYNTGRYVELDPSLFNKNIILVNNQVDLITQKDYTSIGAKYRDAISHLNGYDIITLVDDDDWILSNHITEGVKGYKKALSLNKLAYKPKYSWYRSKEGVVKMNNIFEGSFFLNFDYIKNATFPPLSVKYHNEAWVNPLERNEKILVLEEGKSTWIYDWNVPVYKMSGRPEGKENFDLSTTFSNDKGDGIISKISQRELEELYKEINDGVQQ